MNLVEAQDRFIQIWGTVGVEWGINKTMAQVHGLLLATAHPLSTDDIMEHLSISRGNANMNVRELIAWGLVYRESIPGDRKDYFIAEKDMWEVAQKIASERRKRELDPMMKMIEQLLELSDNKSDRSEEFQSFRTVLTDIHDLGEKSRNLLDFVLRVDRSAFFKPFKALLKGR